MCKVICLTPFAVTIINVQNVHFTIRCRFFALLRLGLGSIAHCTKLLGQGSRDYLLPALIDLALYCIFSLQHIL